MQSAWLGSDKYQFESHWFDSTKVQTRKIQIPKSPKTEDGRFTLSAIPFVQGVGVSEVGWGSEEQRPRVEFSQQRAATWRIPWYSTGALEVWHAT